MSYTLPLVRVYQQLEEVSPTLPNPDLPACIIGRAYQVLTYADNKSEIAAGTYDPTTGASFTPPNKVTGGILNEDSVKIYMDEMEIQITDGTFDASENTAYVEDTGKDFTALTIDVGDKVYISHASLSEDLIRTILSVEETKLHINKNFGSDLVGATYQVVKILDDRQLGSGDFTIDDGVIEIPVSLTHSYSGTTYPVLGGNIYCEYKALRTDLTSSIDEITSSDEIQSKVGIISKENPLALGLSLAERNTVTGVKFIAVDTDEDSDLGWDNVRDLLENDTDVYFLSLLTDKSSVISTFGSHCTQMSTAENHGWRVCAGGTPLPLEKEVVEESSTGVIYEDGGILYLRDNEQEFLSDGVSPSDTIEITAPTAITGSYIVNTVVNDNVIEPSDDTPFESTTSGVTYTVKRALTKSQQADDIADVISSYNNKRVIIVWPDEIEVGGEVVDGYFSGCVIAGMVAGLPPHQGFTNLGIAGVERLYHSNTYFNKTQLNTIAGAGGYIFVQDNPNSLPYVRHQLTTDMQFVETRELSVVKNFDHLSYYFFGALSPFIGPYNVTDRTVELVEETIRLAGEAKQKEVLPKIGAPLKSFDIVSVGESSISSDRTEGKVKLDLPKPLNNIDLFLSI